MQSTGSYMTSNLKLDSLEAVLISRERQIELLQTKHLHELKAFIVDLRLPHRVLGFGLGVRVVVTKLQLFNTDGFL